MKEYPLRRTKQALNEKEIQAVIDGNTYAVLALSSKDGEPYAVPLNYAYENNCFYFHCAKEGHKMELLKENTAASLCIVDRDELVREKYTTAYISVIAFGTVKLLTEKEERFHGLELIADAFGTGDPLQKQDTMAHTIDKVGLFALQAERITGKCGSLLLKKKEK